VVRVRSHLGKYRIDRRLAEGGYAAVYAARDTVSGASVALKIPQAEVVTKEMLDAFHKEVRLTSKLDHPNILPIKDAGTINGVFYVATPLGRETLGDRLGRRLAPRTMMDYASQMLEAVAYAHGKRIMHCDIKPENFILFPEDRLRLADFGIAKVAIRTMPASGSGTIGYVAPEQAMGKPSFRSDVFSLGLILYRMFSGQLPEWPYRWPPHGFDRVHRSLHPRFVALLRRALEVDSSKRFADAVTMRRAFERARPRAIRRPITRRGKKTAAVVTWRSIRWHEFTKQFGSVLQARESCARCGGPMAEAMQNCPWCGVARRAREERTRFPRRCPRCQRGIKSDWRFCPWCYGETVNPEGYRRWSDAAYVDKCRNKQCEWKWLMPFMRYCPWCRRKVSRAWPIEGSKDRCTRCGWGVLRDFWEYCPWCASKLAGRERMA